MVVENLLLRIEKKTKNYETSLSSGNLSWWSLPDTSASDRSWVRDFLPRGDSTKGLWDKFLATDKLLVVFFSKIPFKSLSIRVEYFYG